MRVLSMLCLLAATVGLSAAADKKSSGAKSAAKVRVTGLSIQKPPAAKSGGMTFPPTTTLQLLVAESGKYILGIDAKASKLDSFTDDKNNNLYKKSGGLFGGQPNWINPSAGLLGVADGEYGVQITATAAPGKGATKIRAKGTFSVQYGASEKTLDKKEIALKPNTEVTVGDFKVSVTYAGGFGAGLSVVSSEPRLKTVEFFDAAGKALKPTYTSRMSFPIPGGKRQTTVTYSLGGNLKDKIAFKVTYFSQTETVSVPFDLRVGLDLE